MSVAPDDLFEIVHGGSDFTFPEWQTSLFSTKAFRVVGLAEVLSELGVDRRRYGYDLQDAERASLAVPDSWRGAFAPSNLRHPWDELGRPQPNLSVSSGVQLFHKACLSVLYAPTWLEKRDYVVPADYFQRVRVVPITYTVSGFDDDFYEKHVDGKGLRDLLRKAIKLKRSELVDELFVAGRRFCKENCDALISVLTAHGPSEKSDGSRLVYRRTSDAQKPFNSSNEELELEILLGLKASDAVETGSPA